MTEALEKLVNEIPTIAVAVWAVLNAIGIDISDADREAWVTGLTSVGGFAIWLLVRRNTDGPVTAYKQHKEHSGH